jgi:5-methylcytosine-specific restriction endonuclease McrA
MREWRKKNPAKDRAIAGRYRNSEKGRKTRSAYKARAAELQHKGRQRRRFEVLMRSGFRCVYCGRPAGEVELHVDHVTPKARGGTDNPANLVAACAECNFGKGAIEIKPIEN